MSFPLSVCPSVCLETLFLPGKYPFHTRLSHNDPQLRLHNQIVLEVKVKVKVKGQISRDMGTSMFSTRISPLVDSARLARYLEQSE